MILFQRRALACALLLAAPCASFAADPPPARTLTTRFTYTATVPAVPSGAKALNLWLPIPSNSPWQHVDDLTVDSRIPYRITREPRFGNRMVFVHSTSPQNNTAITVSFIVTRHPVQVLAKPAEDGNATADPLAGTKVDGAHFAALLKPDRMVPVGGKYGQIARDVMGDHRTPISEAHAFFNNVIATMHYDYKHESPKLGDGDVAFVCDYKLGNCSDLHSYLIALARSVGIPAYLEFGFPIAGIPFSDPLPKDGTITGYHCWVWFHDPTRGWIPIDAADGRRWLDAKLPAAKNYLFGDLITERTAVAMSRGRDITLQPPQKSAPLNYFIYPYAEADGKPVDATWTLKYHLIDEVAENAPAGDLQEQVAELRRLALEQQDEIARLQAQIGGHPAATPVAAFPAETAPGTAPVAPQPAAAAAGAAPVPVNATMPASTPQPVPPSPKPRFNFYGFLRLDAIYDSSITNNAQTPFYVLSPSNPNVGGAGNSVFTMHPRLSRLGLNISAPPGAIKNGSVTGKFEVDFQNGGGLTAESRPLPRIRHAYIQVQKGSNSWLFGQTWDLISPLFPSPNDDTLMWNAGNLGDRRPQIRYTYAPRTTPFNAAVALGLTGAVDAQDLDANGVRDGENSGLPNVQARFGWKRSNLDAGIWGHYAWEKTTKAIAGKTRFNSYSAGLDAKWQPTRKWDLMSEIWTGSNLSDFRGGIGQGINATTGDGIRSRGGWIEPGYHVTPKYRVAVGYTLDDPVGADVPMGGRTRNSAIYLHNQWQLPANLEIGANYLYWTTQWKGQDTGIDNRFNWFIQENF